MPETKENSVEITDDLTRHPYHELARRLCAAVKSYHLGLSLEYTLKVHVPKEEALGYMWYSLAELVTSVSFNDLEEYLGMKSYRGKRETCCKCGSFKEEA